LTATGTYGDGSTAALTTGVTWISATPSVATINASGAATGIVAGTAAVTAAVGTITSPAVTLTVTPPALVSIAITPLKQRILVNGGITQFTAIGTYANSTTATITTQVTWSSATAATATIGAATGLATVATPAPAVGATTVVTASLGSITSNAATLTVSPVEFALVTNFTDATVSQYYVAGNGVLTPQTPATITTTTATSPTNVWPYSVVVDPTGSFAYVANYGTSGRSVAQYTIDKTTGLLTANGPNIATGQGPNGLAIFPSAASPFLYSVNINEHTAPYSRAISEFVYSSTGVLSNNSVAPFVAVTPPAGSTVAPYPAAMAIVNGAGGAYAYVSDFTVAGQPSYITEYSVGANGVLAPLSTPSIASGLQPNSIVVSPNGSNVYAVNTAGASVSQYSIGAGGELAPLSQATVAASSGAESIAFTPAGNYAYVANCPEVNGTPVNNGSISEYSVSTTDGSLTLIGTQTANVGLCPSFLTVDPSGQFLYVTNRGIIQATAPPYGTTVSEFSVGGDGSLTPLSSPTVTTGNQPTGIVVFSP
jgi:6-phosphogluconolactonase (cycloisomerase 2 family)